VEVVFTAADQAAASTAVADRTAVDMVAADATKLSTTSFFYVVAALRNAGILPALPFLRAPLQF